MTKSLEMFWSWRITEIKMDRWSTSTWGTKHERHCHLDTCVFKHSTTASISPALASHEFIFLCHPPFSVQKLTSSDVFGNPSVCSAGLRRAPRTDNTLNRPGQLPKTASAKRQHTTALNIRTCPKLTWWVLQRSSLLCQQWMRRLPFGMLLLVFFPWCLCSFNLFQLTSVTNASYFCRLL